MDLSIDDAVWKQVEATHAHDGREFAVKPLLDIVEDIFQRAAPSVPGFVQTSTQAQLELLDDKVFQSDFFHMLDRLSFTINKVSCEMSCKCSGGGDAQATTLGIFNLLSSYTWDVKVVLALAAFALNYGEFWVVAQLYTTNPLAKSVAMLKQLPELLERADTLKSKFEAVSNLIKAMLDVTKCILEFKELLSQYITSDTPEIVTATAHVPAAVYWIISSIVACTEQIMGLVGMGHEYIVSAAEAWDLSSLADKVNSIHSLFKDQLNLCYKIKDEYRALIKVLETPHVDNRKVIQALISAKDDQPLVIYKGSGMKRVTVDVLSKKNVLLLISDLDISIDELLEKMYQGTFQNSTSTESQYEVVWIPVVDRTIPLTKAQEQQFESLQRRMPWYSISHPSMVGPAVIRYIKECWHFKKKPILVVLDRQGNVVNTNALHMIWIWGSDAFPFTSAREKSLWREASRTLELLAYTVHPSIPTWISEEKYVCIYGGEDLEWIRKFTEKIKVVARDASIQLEMLYVGKSNPKDKVQRIVETINESEELGHTLQNLPQVGSFWVRLESMWHSKMKHNKKVDDDSILQEIVTMLSFDGSDHCWAVFYGGTDKAKAKGDNILQSFENYGSWKDNAVTIGFLPALKQYLIDQFHSRGHCNRLILPGTTGTIPERVVCPDCGRQMEIFIMYRCCTD